jgi:hypothetical protein
MSIFLFKRPGVPRQALSAVALALIASLTMTAYAQVSQAPAEPLPAHALPATLRMQDFFQMPIGPRGLVITDRLRQAQGRQVRITGYVVQQEVATLGQFLLTPRPVLMSQHADGEADDLPPATVFVRLNAAQQDWAVAHARGLVEVTGTLEVGRQEERDGRVSWFRLQLAPDAVRTMSHFEVTQYLHKLQHSH